MSSLLFRNIAGRCGRAGVYTEGDTIIFDNPVGPPEFTFSAARSGYQQNVFLRDEPEELQSVVELITGDGAEDLYAALSSQFTAAIPENPTDEDLATNFATHMYAETRPGGRELTQALLSQMRTELLGRPGFAPLAVEQSPLRLTALGNAANATQFSPQSVYRLLAFLNEARPRWTLPHVAASVMRELGDVPEQVNADLRAQVARAKRGFPVHPDDYEVLVESWIEGSHLPRDLLGNERRSSVEQTAGSR